MHRGDGDRLGLASVPGRGDLNFDLATYHFLRHFVVFVGVGCDQRAGIWLTYRHVRPVQGVGLVVQASAVLSGAAFARDARRMEDVAGDVEGNIDRTPVIGEPWGDSGPGFAPLTYLLRAHTGLGCELLNTAGTVDGGLAVELLLVGTSGGGVLVGVTPDGAVCGSFTCQTLDASCDLGRGAPHTKIVVDQRVNANHTEGAIWKDTPLTIDDVLASPVIADPLHMLEIVMPCMGGSFRQ